MHDCKDTNTEQLIAFVTSDPQIRHLYLALWNLTIHRFSNIFHTIGENKIRKRKISSWFPQQLSKHFQFIIFLQLCDKDGEHVDPFQMEIY